MSVAAFAETGLFLDGLRCAGCVNRTERALRAAEGVAEASVNYTNHRALVRFDPSRTSPDALVACVEALGYHATPYDPAALERPERRAAREALVRVLVAGFLAMNVMWIAVALYTGSYQGMEPEVRDLLRWLVVLLSVPAVTWCAFPFWSGAVSGLRRGELTIDVPIVLGIAVSFAVSVVGTLAGTEHLYLDSAAMIVFLILLGRTLERGARAKATGAVDRLTALTPATALRRTADGLEEVAAASLVVGDRVVVPPGQVAPADGRLVLGSTEVDESPFTGESRPVLRREGELLTGGTRNLLAEVEIEVAAPVTAGTLARLAALLERAQAERPRIQRLADRVAAVFAPAVLAVAALTAAAWAAKGASPMEIALTTAAVLIVACPCALGLATPAAVTAAVGRAASLGILVKTGEALERCARADAVLLDKTGTLTEGRFRIDGIAGAPGVAEGEVLAWAAAAEGEATHPLAEAIRRGAQMRGRALAEVEERRARPGQGVVARAGGEEVRVGTDTLLAEAGVSVAEALQEAGAKFAERGLSLAWVSRGRRALGVIGVWDPPREDAAETVERLRALGARVSLVTGDHDHAAALAAERSGIVEVEARVSPEGKVEQVRDRRAAGERVLVAGDGINDAAALGAADVGVAMARGSDVTLHAADVVIRAPRLGALADLIELSRSALARIRENLGFAVAYNAVAVPLAVGGWLEPLHAAVAMSLSSVIVTANAVRLLRWRPRA